MSALSRFEELVERIVEGSIVSLLGAEVQPVEIAKRLARALESERAIGVGRAIAPNEYTVCLHPEDFERFAPIQRSLEAELEGYLKAAADERHLTFLVRPSVRLESSPSVGKRQMAVAARFAEKPAASAGEAALVEHTQRFQAIPQELLPPLKPSSQAPSLGFVLVARSDGASFPIRGPVTTLGRALDNDVVLEDSRISRYHAEIRVQGATLLLRDLRSTNGTAVNGRAIGQSAIKDGDVISLGGVEMTLRARSSRGREHAV